MRCITVPSRPAKWAGKPAKEFLREIWPLSEFSGFSGHTSFVARNEMPCRQREAHILNARGQPKPGRRFFRPREYPFPNARSGRASCASPRVTVTQSVYFSLRDFGTACADAPDTPDCSKHFHIERHRIDSPPLYFFPSLPCLSCKFFFVPNATLRRIKPVSSSEFTIRCLALLLRPFTSIYRSKHSLSSSCSLLGSMGWSGRRQQRR